MIRLNFYFYFDTMLRFRRYNIIWNKTNNLLANYFTSSGGSVLIFNDFRKPNLDWGSMFYLLLLYAHRTEIKCKFNNISK